MHFGVWCNYIRRLAAKYGLFSGTIMLVVLVFLAGCSPSTHQNTSNSSKAVGPSTPSSSTESAGSDIENNTNDSSSITLTGRNFPDWFMNDLKLASEVKFPTKADEYLNQDMDGQINYANRIKSFDFWKVTGIDGQLWVAGYTGTKTVSAYSSYVNMIEYYQRVTNASNENNLNWGSLTPVLMFESDKTTFVSVMSWYMGNARWIAFAPDKVIIKSNHAAVDMYEVINVPGIKIPE